MRATQKRILTVISFIVAALSLIATVTLALLAIWTDDYRFAETAFVSFMLLVPSASVAIALTIP